MPEFFQNLFTSKDFMPHGMCYSWDPAVLWLNVISDSLIAAAYYAIPFLVFYFVTKRRDISFKGVYFAVRYFRSGLRHHPPDGRGHRLEPGLPSRRRDQSHYGAGVDGHVRMLVPMMPMLISLPSPGQMARANLSLARRDPGAAGGRRAGAPD